MKVYFIANCIDFCLLNKLTTDNNTTFSHDKSDQYQIYQQNSFSIGLHASMELIKRNPILHFALILWRHHYKSTGD